MFEFFLKQLQAWLKHNSIEEEYDLAKDPQLWLPRSLKEFQSTEWVQVHELPEHGAAYLRFRYPGRAISSHLFVFTPESNQPINKWANCFFLTPYCSEGKAKEETVLTCLHPNWRAVIPAWGFFCMRCEMSCGYSGLQFHLFVCPQLQWEPASIVALQHPEGFCTFAQYLSKVRTQAIPKQELKSLTPKHEFQNHAVSPKDDASNLPTSNNSPDRDSGCPILPEGQRLGFRHALSKPLSSQQESIQASASQMPSVPSDAKLDICDDTASFASRASSASPKMNSSRLDTVHSQNSTSHPHTWNSMHPQARGNFISQPITQQPYSPQANMYTETPHPSYGRTLSTSESHSVPYRRAVMQYSETPRVPDRGASAAPSRENPPVYAPATFTRRHREPNPLYYGFESHHDTPHTNPGSHFQSYIGAPFDTELDWALPQNWSSGLDWQTRNLNNALLFSSQNLNHTHPCSQNLNHTSPSSRNLNHTSPSSSRNLNYVYPSSRNLNHASPSSQNINHTSPSSSQDLNHTSPSSRNLNYTSPSSRNSEHASASLRMLDPQTKEQWESSQWNPPLGFEPPLNPPAQQNPSLPSKKHNSRLTNWSNGTEKQINRSNFRKSEFFPSVSWRAPSALKREARKTNTNKVSARWEAKGGQSKEDTKRRKKEEKISK